MEKVRPNAGLGARRAYGFALARMLHRKRQPDLQRWVADATDAAVTADREVSDAERPAQAAVADRVLASAELDDCVRLIARKLAARGPRAEREAPYTTVLRGGLTACTRATIASRAAVFTGLLDRLEDALPADDPIRSAFAPRLRKALAGWDRARVAVDAARARRDAARQARRDAYAAWDVAIDRAYGTLVARVGKAAADRCFPRSGRRGPSDPGPAPAPAARRGDPSGGDPRPVAREAGPSLPPTGARVCGAGSDRTAEIDLALLAVDLTVDLAVDPAGGAGFARRPDLPSVHTGTTVGTDRTCTA